MRTTVTFLKSFCPWYTLPETNIAPDNGWLEDYIFWGLSIFRGKLLVSGSVIGNMIFPKLLISAQSLEESPKTSFNTVWKTDKLRVCNWSNFPYWSLNCPHTNLVETTTNKFLQISTVSQTTYPTYRCFGGAEKLPISNLPTLPTYEKPLGLGESIAVGK